MPAQRYSTTIYGWIALTLILFTTSRLAHSQADLEVEPEAAVESAEAPRPRVVLPFSGVPPYEDPVAEDSRSSTTSEAVPQAQSEGGEGRERLSDLDHFRAAKQARRAQTVRQYALPDPPAGEGQPPRPDEGDASTYAVRLQAELQRADGVAAEGNR